MIQHKKGWGLGACARARTHTQYTHTHTFSGGGKAIPSHLTLAAERAGQNPSHSSQAWV